MLQKEHYHHTYEQDLDTVLLIHYSYGFCLTTKRIGPQSANDLH